MKRAVKMKWVVKMKRPVKMKWAVKMRQWRATMSRSYYRQELKEEANVTQDRLSVGRFKHGCKHYRRRCKIRAPCCNEIFDCRHCHNEAKNINEVDDSKRHDIPRHHVEKVICSLCDHEQDVKQICEYCGVCMGNYYCEKCKFFSDHTEEEQSYHCDACGVCLHGCREDFIHCDYCGSCFTKAEFETGHSCAENVHPLPNRDLSGWQIITSSSGQRELIPDGDGTEEVVCPLDQPKKKEKKHDQQRFEMSSSNGDSMGMSPEMQLQLGFREQDRSCKCDGCGSSPILNRRWHCNICIDYDLCEICYNKGNDNPLSMHKDHLMTFIPVNNTLLKEEYEFCICGHCGKSPIFSDRWRCEVCVDFDLCDVCYYDSQDNPTGFSVLSHLGVHPMIHIEVDDIYLKGLGYEEEYWETSSSSLDEAQEISSPSAQQELSHVDNNIDEDGTINFFVCNGCWDLPQIVNERWCCNICPEYNLCRNCYNTRDEREFWHPISHPMTCIPVDNSHAEYEVQPFFASPSDVQWSYDGSGLGRGFYWIPATSSTVPTLDADSELQGLSVDSTIKHKVFLSHAGSEKEFVQQLWKIIRDCGVFFDKDEQSLPIGEEFPENIRKAAKECELAIVVISNDFFLRKWPMLELAIFVEEQKKRKSLKILPLFYKLTVEQVKESKRQEVWFKKWKTFARPGQIDEWKEALRVLCTFNGKSFKDYDSEPAYRGGIKKTILEIIPPYVMISDSSIEGDARLSKVILENLEISPSMHSTTESKSHSPFLVGMFGMGGEGKTTLSKMICDYLFLKFNGRVCHVEFEGNLKYEKEVRQVLQKFTNLDDINSKASTLEEGHNLLRRYLVKQPVFLVLDNVWDYKTLEEVEKYLQLPFHDGSIVLITARTTEILEKIKIGDECKWGNIFAVPSMEVGEARSLFAKRAGCSLTSLSIEQKQNLEKFVAACCFNVIEHDPNKKELQADPISRGKYHPLAIKVLAAKVGSDPLAWRDEDINFKSETNEKSDPLFQVLRLGFEALPYDYQRVFVDIVLYVDILRPRDGTSLFRYENKKPIVKICNQLHMLYNKGEEQIMHMLEVFKARSLLESVTEDDVYIHDLYIQFAQNEVKSKAISSFKGTCCFYKDRLVITDTTMSDLIVKEDLRNEILQTEWIIVAKTNIKTLDLRGMKCLSILQVESNNCLETIYVENNRSLQQLQWNFGVGSGGFKVNLPSLAGVVDLRQLTIKQHRDLYHKLHRSMFGVIHREDCPDKVVEWSDGQKLHYFSDCTNLEDLELRNLPNIRVLPDLEPLKDSLERLHLQDLMNMVEPPDLKWLTSLMYLTFKDLRITQLPGLENLVEMRYLKLKRCRYITAIPGIECLLELELLCLQRLKALATLPSLSRLHKLKVLDITRCNQLSSLDLGPLPTSLIHFEVNCKKLVLLPDLSQSPLEEFSVRGPLITKIPGLDGFSKLEVLYCLNTSMVELPQLNSMRSLKRCFLNGCRKLEYLPEGLDLPVLEELHLSLCKALKQLPQALNLPSLKVLNLYNCSTLEQIVAVGGLKSLRTLTLEDCPLLWYLPETMAMPALEELSFRGCSSLQQLPNLSGCKALKLLKLGGSLVDPNMVKLPTKCIQVEKGEDPSTSVIRSPRQADNTVQVDDTVQVDNTVQVDDTVQERPGDTSTGGWRCAIL